MAAGLTRAIELFSAETAANGVPTAADDGISMNDIGLGVFDRFAATLAFLANGTTPGAVLRMWGRVAGIADWGPLGVGADADKGKLNEGNSIGETSTGKAVHIEPLDLPHHLERIYCEIVSVSGTITDAQAHLVFGRK